MDGRSLLDGNSTPTRENRNVFDDEFEVEDFDGVADGFRPGYNHDREGGGSQDLREEAVRTVSAQYASGSVTPNAPSRNSTRKSQSRENPFASPEDENGNQLHRTPSGNFATYAHRSISSSSSHQFARTNSGSRFGSDGPSHPYEMYTQGTVARTPSTATASTTRPTRQSTLRNGPQHPYALYPQGVDGLDDEQNDPQSQVPVGFLGLGQSYQRQRGPEGEEQDFIGDYGHAEQLPPYSRYPEDGPEKVPLMSVPDPPVASHTRAPVLGTDPSMSLMHTQLQPSSPQSPQQQPQSMTDESALDRQISRGSRASAPLLPEAESSPEDSLGQKSWSEKSWTEKRRTRICGVPFWCVLIAAGVLALVAIIAGSVLGGYAEGKKSTHKPGPGSSSTPLYDASLIATPTNTAPPTGTYSLVFGTPQETESSCLSKPAQQAAWNCDLARNADIELQISSPVWSNQSGAYLYSTNPDTSSLWYGTQSSSILTTFSPFLLVKDNDDPENGEAFYFQTNYDKVVAVPGDALPGGVEKRSAYDIPDDWFGVKTKAEAYDKFWFCYFNNTFLEGFIYPDKNAAIPTHISSTTSMPSTTKTSGTTSQTATAVSYWPTYLPEITQAPAEYITTTMTLPSTTCTYTGVASALPSWLHDKYPNELEMGDDSPPVRKLRRGDDDDNEVNDGDIPYDDGSDGTPPPYPYLMKFEERRLPDAPAPYCVQYQVLVGGDFNVIGDADGNDIVVQLTEFEDTPPRSRKVRRTEEPGPGTCHCQWMVGE